MYIIPFNPPLIHNHTETVLQTNPKTEEIAFIFSAVFALTTILIFSSFIIYICVDYLKDNNKRKKN